MDSVNAEKALCPNKGKNAPSRISPYSCNRNFVDKNCNFSHTECVNKIHSRIVSFVNKDPYLQREDYNPTTVHVTLTGIPIMLGAK